MARILSNLVFLFALTLSVGSNSDDGQTNYGSAETEREKQAEERVVSYVELAKRIVGDYDLTQVRFECLKFENMGETQGFKAIVYVRELHNEGCQGDVLTSPRLFSIAFDKNDEVWSDAKSLLGQLEPLD